MTAKAGFYSFIIEQGSTTYFTISYKDSNKEPVDLTGYHARMQIRPDYADFAEEKYINLSSSLDDDGSGLYITPKEGKIDVVMSAAKTELFDFDDGFYDLELYRDCEFTDKYVLRLIQGKVRINREVTRGYDG